MPGQPRAVQAHTRYWQLVAAALVALTACLGGNCGQPGPRSVCDLARRGSSQQTAAIYIGEGAVVAGDVFIQQYAGAPVLNCYSHGVPNQIQTTVGPVYLGQIGAIASCAGTDRDECRNQAWRECLARVQDFAMSNNLTLFGVGCGPAMCDSCRN